MPRSPVPPLASDRPAWHAWLRLTLAAFVLTLYTSIALATGGIARADDDQSASGGKSETSTAAQHSDSADTKPHSASGTPGAASGPAAGEKSTDTPKSTGTAEPSDPTASPQQPSDATDTAQDTTVEAGVQAQSSAPGDTIPTPTATPTPEAVVPVAVDVDEVGPAQVTPTDVADSHNSKQAGRPALVAVPASVDSRHAVPNAPTSRSLVARVDVEPTTAAVTAIAPSEPPAPGPPAQANLGNQFAGLVSDVGTVTLSAVHTVAATVAQAFGPGSFLGVPYLLASTVANAAAAAGRTLVGAPLLDPSTGPFTVTYGILDGLAFFNPAKPPAGANDPKITVTAEHPLPIILLNGTVATQGENWSVGAPVLANAGYKVYTFNYGNITSDPNFPIQSTDDIRQSGQELAAEVERVLRETGAPKVILIGHSQGGGILPVHYINNLDGAAKVSQLIGIAPSNHGTDFNGLTALQSLPFFGPLAKDIADIIGPALFQQTLGSPFQQEVYGNGDTRPGVLYTTIASVNDEVVTPYTQQALAGPNVTNIVLQDRYPGVVIGHANVIVSPQTWAVVLDALASNPAANPGQVQDAFAA